MTTFTTDFRQITEQPVATAPRFFEQDCRAIIIADEQYWAYFQTS